MLNVSKTEEISEKCPKNSLIFCKIRNKTTNYTNYTNEYRRTQTTDMHKSMDGTKRAARYGINQDN